MLFVEKASDTRSPHKCEGRAERLDRKRGFEDEDEDQSQNRQRLNKGQTDKHRHEHIFRSARISGNSFHRAGDEKSLSQTATKSGNTHTNGRAKRQKFQRFRVSTRRCCRMILGKHCEAHQHEGSEGGAQFK